MSVYAGTGSSRRETNDGMALDPGTKRTAPIERSTRTKSRWNCNQQKGRQKETKSNKPGHHDGLGPSKVETRGSYTNIDPKQYCL